MNTARVGQYTITVETEPARYSYETADSFWYELKDRHGNDYGHGRIASSTLDAGTITHILTTEFTGYGYGGYPAYFVGDGYCLCATCGIAILADPNDDSDFEYIVDDSMGDNPSGQTCDGCSEWIYEPFCADCAKSESELGDDNALEFNICGDHCVCRQCIANALVWTRELERDHTDDLTNYQQHKTQAHLIGPNAYELSNAWFAGTYGKGGYAALGH